MSASRSARGLARWDAYWFQSVSLGHLAIARIVLVAFQLLWYATSGLGERVMGGVAAFDFVPRPTLVFTILSAPFGGVGAMDAAVLSNMYAVAWAAGVLALFGIFTRVSLAAFAFANLFLLSWVHSYAQLVHSEALLSIALALLAFAPAGRAYSVDGLGRGDRGTSEWAAWPLLATQSLLAIAYFSAFVAKVGASGTTWANGSTLQYFAYVKGLTHGHPLGIWLSQQHELARLLSAGALVFEATFWLTLFCPRLVLPMVVGGAMLHTGIYFTIGAPFFQFIALYVVFLPSIRRGGLGMSQTSAGNARAVSAS